MGEVTDITVEILRSIRDEISQLRADTNARFEQIDKRFEQMDKRFEQMDKRLEQMDKRFEQIDKRLEQMDQRFEHIEADIRAIASHFDRDYMILANKVGELEGRLDAHVEAHG